MLGDFRKLFKRKEFEGILPIEFTLRTEKEKEFDCFMQLVGMYLKNEEFEKAIKIIRVMEGKDDNSKQI